MPEFGKKEGSRTCRLPEFPVSGSEAELRTEHDLQVVVGATIKVNLVAYVHAQPDGARIELNAAARIEHAVRVALEDVDRVAEGGGSRRVRVRYAELQKPALHRREQANCAAARLELRAE